LRHELDALLRQCRHGVIAECRIIKVLVGRFSGSREPRIALVRGSKLGVVPAGKNMGLRVNEWVILGLKARQTGGLRRTFALRLGSEFAMNVGWHEH